VEFKYCPQCGDEFQNWAERCPDCDVALGFDRPTAAAAAPSEELPPARDLAPVFVGEPWQVRDPIATLGQAGIACRVDAYPPGDIADSGEHIGGFGAGTKVGVYVRPDDVAAVTAIDAEWVRSTLAAEAALEHCPACDAPLAADATGCGECGLEFPEIAVCERCGSAMEPGAPACGVCGASLV